MLSQEETHANSDGGDELEDRSGDDEPDGVSEHGIDVVRVVVETVPSGDEQAKIQSESDDGDEESEERHDGGEDSARGVGEETEEEGDEDDTGSNGVEDKCVC